MSGYTRTPITAYRPCHPHRPTCAACCPSLSFSISLACRSTAAAAARRASRSKEAFQVVGGDQKRRGNGHLFCCSDVVTASAGRREGDAIGFRDGEALSLPRHKYTTFLGPSASAERIPRYGPHHAVLIASPAAHAHLSGDPAFRSPAQTPQCAHTRLLGRVMRTARAQSAMNGSSAHSDEHGACRAVHHAPRRPNLSRPEGDGARTACALSPSLAGVRAPSATRKATGAAHPAGSQHALPTKLVAVGCAQCNISCFFVHVVCALFARSATLSFAFFNVFTRSPAACCRRATRSRR